MSNREPVRGQAIAGDNSATRREFLTGIPSAVAAAAVPFASSAEAGDGSSGDSTDARERVIDSHQIREEAARAETKVPIPKQSTNGDEQNSSNFIGNFSKGLPHNSIGEVDKHAYRSFLNALHQGTAAALEKVPLGGNVKLVNTLAGLSFDLEGTDSHQQDDAPRNAAMR